MPTKQWLELSIEVPFEFVEPVAELFRRYGKGGVAIEEAGGWNPDEGERQAPNPSAIVRTYMPQTPAYQVKREIVHIGISLIGKITDLPELQERGIAEAEWEAAWKAHFTPLRVGQRLVVQPPWHPADAVDGRVVIEIDPGLAFGTGHHPTTFRTLEAMERLVTPGADVLDVGAGSGILSVGAAKLGAGKVIGVEIDKIALKAGRANLRANGVAAKVRFYGGTLPSPHVLPGWADLVLANVNSVALANLAPELKRALKPGGWLVAAGILEERRQQVEDAFAKAGLDIQEHVYDGEWVLLLAR
ncbi:MAG: 50S ribosomal protein L11 methyltransferase [Dehalococcoidia bacterium]